MRTSSKVLLGLSILAAVVIAAGIYVSRRLNPTVADLVESYGAEATGTRVRVGAVDVSLRDSRATLKGFVIDNPPGYSTPYLLRIDEIDVQLDVASLARPAIVLRDVALKGATLEAEQHGTSSNLTEVLDHVEHAGGTTPAQPSAAAEPGTKLIVDRFRLTDGRVRLTSDALSGPQSIDLADVTARDVGRAEGGLDLTATADALLRPILAAARDAVRGRLQKAAGDAAKSKLEDAARKRLEELTRPGAGDKSP